MHPPPGVGLGAAPAGRAKAGSFGGPIRSGGTRICAEIPPQERREEEREGRPGW